MDFITNVRLHQNSVVIDGRRMDRAEAANLHQRAALTDSPALALCDAPVDRSRARAASRPPAPPAEQGRGQATKAAAPSLPLKQKEADQAATEQAAPVGIGPRTHGGRMMTGGLGATGNKPPFW